MALHTNNWVICACDSVFIYYEIYFCSWQCNIKSLDERMICRFWWKKTSCFSFIFEEGQNPWASLRLLVGKSTTFLWGNSYWLLSQVVVWVCFWKRDGPQHESFSFNKRVSPSGLCKGSQAQSVLQEVWGREKRLKALFSCQQMVVEETANSIWLIKLLLISIQ